MEFRTKLVIKRKNKRAYIAYAGLFIAASSLILVFIPSMEDDIPWVFGVGIAIVVIGAVIARGDVANYGLSEEELVVSLAGISVGSQRYPMQSITNMDFNVEAYAGLYVNDGAMVSGSNSDGMTNGLTFEVEGRKIDCGFFLENKMHVQQLAMVFNELYERHIPFVERNRSTRTYMFQILNERELVEFKRRYGY
ncbi:MAG TPA: hypothetical protein VGM30_12780 [Puia sp.]|jgi:hypothetical protein